MLEKATEYFTQRAHSAPDSDEAMYGMFLIAQIEELSKKKGAKKKHDE
jgi:hypothetical protein